MEHSASASTYCYDPIGRYFDYFLSSKRWSSALILVFSLLLYKCPTFWYVQSLLGQASDMDLQYF